MPALNVDVSTDGSTLVAAPGVGRFIRIMGYNLQPASTAVVTLKSASTVKATLQGAGPWALSVNKETTIDCVPNEALVLGNAGTVRVTGVIEYVVYGSPPGNF